MMTPQQISEKLTSSFGDSIVETKIDGVIDYYVKIKAEKVVEIARFIRDEGDLAFDFLMCLSGLDNGKEMLGVVYHLYSMKNRHKLTLKVEVPRSAPEVPSVTEIWPSANWHEREAYDLLGVKFVGHPDLRRILMPYDWDGHPLRKDYKVPEFYHGMKVPY